MSNEKPVELTEAERADVFRYSDQYQNMLHVVTRIVAAREAAAHREALLGAERLGKVVHDAATDLLNISAYLIRASYHEDVDRLEQALRGGSARGKALRDRLRAALAEPGRDEEGGR